MVLNTERMSYLQVASPCNVELESSPRDRVVPPSAAESDGEGDIVLVCQIFVHPVDRGISLKPCPTSRPAIVP